MEIDALRGLAVLCMIFFHGFLDASFLGLLTFHAFVWPWILAVRAVQILFLILVGVSVFLSSRPFEDQCVRGVKIFGAGLLVSLATYWFFPSDYVRFGVLHCIGVAIPLVALFKTRPRGAVLGVVGVLMATSFLQSSSYGAFWSIPFGLPPADFRTLDYFPLFPWLSVPLLGLFVASRVYPQRQPTGLAVLAQVPGIGFLGRHALAIYLLHQPILYFSLWWLFSFKWTHL